MFPVSYSRGVEKGGSKCNEDTYLYTCSSGLAASANVTPSRVGYSISNQTYAPDFNSLDERWEDAREALRDGILDAMTGGEMYRNNKLAVAVHAKVLSCCCLVTKKLLAE